MISPIMYILIISMTSTNHTNTCLHIVWRWCDQPDQTNPCNCDMAAKSSGASLHNFSGRLGCTYHYACMWHDTYKMDRNYHCFFRGWGSSNICHLSTFWIIRLKVMLLKRFDGNLWWLLWNVNTTLKLPIFMMLKNERGLMLDSIIMPSLSTKKYCQNG